MPFIPHTDADERAMLETIGVAALESLFEEIPPALRRSGPLLGPALGEMDLGRLMTQRAGRDGGQLCFIGAGAYDHHIPAAVWEVAGRGEYMTAYTPYQAEASQGTLQVLYEYQSMIAGLTGLDVANASLYDGASALGEAVLMAVRANGGKPRRALIPATVHPRYRQVVQTVVAAQGIEVVEVPFCTESGHTEPAALEAMTDDGFAALVLPQPNFFGIAEPVDALSDWAAERGILRIALVNPLSLGLLKPPGEWGEAGADIACGDGQPLGIPLSSGGPYFGFMACRQAHIRQLPGRIAGRTVDRDGNPGFVLTLQAREQHIRRSRATSNICTNQGLMTVAATIHMALLGPDGLARTAAACHANTVALAERLREIPGLRRRFTGPFFHEIVLESPRPVAPLLAALARRGIDGGFALEGVYPEMKNMFLVCATEKRTPADLDRYVRTLAECLAAEEG